MWYNEDRKAYKNTNLQNNKRKNGPRDHFFVFRYHKSFGYAYISCQALLTEADIRCPSAGTCWYRNGGREPVENYVENFCFLNKKIIQK